ncbi:hypothetical protein V6N13_105713 [Hibiscus sabdariffa]
MGSIASYDELENGVRNNISPLDPEEFRRQGHMIIDFLSDYYHDIEKYPVLSQVEPGYLAKRLPTTAPYVAESVEAILQDVQQHIIPGITHWQSPNYFAYFPSSSSVAGFLASDSKQVVDYKDWQITLSRRFRAMKLWLVLRSYGVANLRNFLRGHVRMAKRFEELVANDSRFKVVVPRHFAMVCFRVLTSASPIRIKRRRQDARERLQSRIIRDGECSWAHIHDSCTGRRNLHDKVRHRRQSYRG